HPVRSVGVETPEVVIAAVARVVEAPWPELARHHAPRGAEDVAVELTRREQVVVVTRSPPANLEIRAGRPFAEHQSVACAIGDVVERDAERGDVKDSVRWAVELSVDVVVRSGDAEVAGQGTATCGTVSEVAGVGRAEVDVDRHAVGGEE